MDGKVTQLRENLSEVAWLALPRKVDMRVTSEKEVRTRRGGSGNSIGIPLL